MSASKKSAPFRRGTNAALELRCQSKEEITMPKNRVMAIDDKQDVTHLVKLILENSKKYEVQTENRPRRALDRIRGFMPDLIILDIDMPGMDGGEVARQMREDPK